MNASLQTLELSYRAHNYHLAENRELLFLELDDFGNLYLPDNLKLQNEPQSTDSPLLVFSKLFDPVYVNSCPELSSQFRWMTVYDFFDVIATQSFNQSEKFITGILSNASSSEKRLILGNILDEMGYYLDQLESLISWIKNRNIDEGASEMVDHEDFTGEDTITVFDIKNHVALDRLNIFKQLIINVLSRSSTLLNINPSDQSRHGTIKFRASLKPEVEVKVILIWANILILLDYLEFEKGYLKIDYIKDMCLAHGIDPPKNPYSNLNDALKTQENYHHFLNDFIDLISNYNEAFRNDQERKSKKWGTDAQDSGIKLKKLKNLA